MKADQPTARVDIALLSRPVIEHSAMKADQRPARIRNIVYTSVTDGLCSAGHSTVADIEAAIDFEARRSVPRMSLISGLKTILRRKQHQALATPKAAA